MNRFTQPAIALAATLAATLALRHWCISVLSGKARHGNASAALLARALKTPLLLWCMAAALGLSVHLTDFTETQTGYIRHSIAVFVIVSLTMVVSSAAIQILITYGREHSMPIATAGMSRALIRVFVFGTGLMFLLRSFGWDITPMLTALGVGGLAVALALKDTFENFFAGIHIMVETPVSVGDFIHVSAGEEGTVTDIGWRTTRLLTTANTTIVIPNSKITSGTLINFNLPDERSAVAIILCVSQNADHNLVRMLALEAASETEGVMVEPGPIVLLDPGMTATHLEMKLVIWCARKLGSALVKSAVQFTLLDKFRAAGIEPPERDKVIHIKG